MSEFAVNGLRQLLASGVVELRFRRRHGKMGHPPHRRMFCTNNFGVLNNIIGKVTLKYRPPKGVGLPYNPAAKGLVPCWDILMCSYRQVPVESVEIVQYWKLTTRKEINEFWSFFMQAVHPMSPEEKQRFIDK